MKILLVMPHPPTKRKLFYRFSYPSLTLQQIAGITPRHHSVKIVDERYEDINFNEYFDIVGITSLTYNALRAYEVADEFRRRGIPVVIGGYHASTVPHEAKQHADA
ncbi:MAG TPA: B12-binding domain-containing radical SAM protein, partial [Thermoplasmatales archaeon]|nr:B12-binding domain-containing radical SAM protein [Thermoplasmatales archaeon]